MPFCVRVYPGVKKSVAKIAKELFSAMSPLARHNVDVYITNTKRVLTNRLKNAVGAFTCRIKRKDGVESPSRRLNPTIAVAGHQFDELEFIFTCCHELGHYEQFRDGKLIQERGIKSRTKSVFKRVAETLNDSQRKRWIAIAQKRIDLMANE